MKNTVAKNPSRSESLIEKIDGSYVYATCKLYQHKEDKVFTVSEVGIAEIMKDQL